MESAQLLGGSASEGEGGTGIKQRFKRCCGCCTRTMMVGACCACCCLTYIILVVIIGIAAKMAIGTLQHGENYQVYRDGVKVVPTNTSAYEWWVGCNGPNDASGSGPTSDITNCGQTCCNCKEREAFREYNAKAAFKAVSFPSRPGDAGQDVIQGLTGWWLPADPNTDTKAAIIIQHGLKGSINDMRVALAAYLVRSAGFSVLLPNLRAHGSSPGPEHGKMSWGWDYPYDVLGAWDYLVNDPDGELGGPRHPSKIGLMGFSMGGFVSATAFGLEHNLAALWLDGPVSNPKYLLHHVTSRTGPLAPLLEALVVPPAWKVAELTAGVSLTHHTPAKTLGNNCPSTKRPVMLVQSPDDKDVPFDMAEFYEDLISSYPECYKLDTTYELGGQCETPGRTETHNVLQWLRPEEYRKTVCYFFSETLLGRACDTSLLTPSFN